MVPIAEWMGADPTTPSFANIFPNLGNFDMSDHIIRKTDLFNGHDI